MVFVQRNDNNERTNNKKNGYIVYFSLHVDRLFSALIMGMHRVRFSFFIALVRCSSRHLNPPYRRRSLFGLLVRPRSPHCTQPSSDDAFSIAIRSYRSPLHYSVLYFGIVWLACNIISCLFITLEKSEENIANKNETLAGRLWGKRETATRWNANGYWLALEIVRHFAHKRA